MQTRSPVGVGTERSSSADSITCGVGMERSSSADSIASWSWYGEINECRLNRQLGLVRRDHQVQTQSPVGVGTERSSSADSIACGVGTKRSSSADSIASWG